MDTEPETVSGFQFALVSIYEKRFREGTNNQEHGQPRLIDVRVFRSNG